MKERKTLTIIEVSAPQEVGEKHIPKLAFKVKEENNVLSYFTFTKRLFSLIKIGEIDADTETTKREVDGNVYIDRKVTEIYTDGKPVGREKWQPRADNPGQRRSIERQVCLKCACELANEDTPMETILAKASKMYQWISQSTLPIVPEKSKSSPLENKDDEIAPDLDFDPLISLPVKRSEKPPLKAVEPEGKIDLTWLKEQMSILHWSNANTLSYLKTAYKVEASSVSGAVAKLNEVQRQDFYAKIKEALEKL